MTVDGGTAPDSSRNAIGVRGRGPACSRLDDKARGGHADLAAVALPGRGARGGRIGARQQMGQQQAPGACRGSLPALKARAGQGAP